LNPGAPWGRAGPLWDRQIDGACCAHALFTQLDSGGILLAKRARGFASVKAFYISVLKYI
jgi:hypothetical protein